VSGRPGGESGKARVGARVVGRVVGVVQARMGSSRLPGKVLMDVEGATMLARVLRRLSRAALLDRVVLATSDLPADDAVAAEAARLGFAVFRGSEEDVLSRYLGAAREHAADVVVRVTADCPLIDPAVVDRTVERFLAESPDYASNSLDRTYPRGLDVEVVDRRALEIAGAEARLDYERVHVTPFLYRHPERFRLLSVTRRDGEAGGHDGEGGEPLGELRWTVDTAPDLELVRRIYHHFLGRPGGGDDGFGWRQVLALVESRPELREINRHVRQKSPEEL